MLHTLLVALVVGVAVSLVANLCHHRLPAPRLAHRALTLRPPVDQVFRFLIWITTGHPAPPVGGRAPQAPRLHRRRGRSALPRAARLGHGADAATSRCTAREARNPRDDRPLRQGHPADDWADRVFYDHALLGLGLGIGDPRRCCSAGRRAAGRVRPRQPATSAGSAAVNAIGHHFGRRPYDNGAGNLQWLAFITAGEGLHNNHHAAPDLGEALAPLVRDRPGLVGDQGPDLVPARQAAPDDRCRRRLHARRASPRDRLGLTPSRRRPRDEVDRKRPVGAFGRRPTRSRGRPRAAAS